ncbi:MAG: hypothetical protein EOO20_29125, partial [Chryseobacterium sp.]
VGDTYLLENADGKYIFKIYRDAHRKLEEIKAEVELLNALHHAGASVAFPLLDLVSKYIQTFNAAEGTRHGVMFTYAEGNVVVDLNDDQLHTLGIEIAKIHEINAGLKLTHPRHEFNLDSMLFSPLNRIKPSFVGLETEYEYLVTTSGVVAERINAMNLGSFSTGYCHYDFLPKNYHFNRAGKVTFFDFDFAGNIRIGFGIKQNALL